MLPLRDLFGAAPPFPPDFLFGVATSDHQCEAYEDRWQDVRDHWERDRRLTRRGRATDFWTRHVEDIGLARGLGCRAFRFSTAWARIEPERDRFDAEVLDHYRGMVERIVGAGMVPVVTLHHFTWPLHVQERGGMIAADFPKWFAAYADKVAESLGAEVGYWITFNEPTYLPFGYLKPWGMHDFLLPPGLEHATSDEQVRAAAALMRNLFLAHREARRAIRARHERARVGTNPFVLGLPSHLQRWLDRHARAQRGAEQWHRRERRILEGYPDLVSGVVDVMFGAFTRTPERERQVLFSSGYAQARPAVMVAAGDPARTSADLAGARIAMARASSGAEAFLKRGVACVARWTSSLDQALRHLERGKVRGVVSDDLLLAPHVERAPERWRLIPLDAPAQSYCGAVALNREALRRELDHAVREVRDGRGHVAGAGLHGQPGAQPAAAPGRPETSRHAAAGAAPPAPGGVTREHVAGAAPPPPDARRGGRHGWLATDPLAAVRRRGELVVGLRRGDSPFAWRDRATGEWRGLEPDIARALAKRLLGDRARVRFLAFDPMWRMGMLRSIWVRPLEFIHRVVTLFSIVSNTDWWYLGMAGRLPAFLCPAECVGELDFVGFDYYWGIPELRWDRLRSLYDSVRADYARAPVHPGGLRRLLTRYARMFPGTEIVIIENGCVERADGFTRADYLRAHAREVQRAIAAGIPVKGYLCWSITSNREWGLPFDANSDFGLYHIELDRDPALKRVETPAVATYREIIRTRSAHPGR
jgi:beta-glucosidase/6-phospho-beta-glucosidase/beta-galactosidase